MVRWRFLRCSWNAEGLKPSKDREVEALRFVDLGVEKRFLQRGALTFRVTDVFDSLQKLKYESTNKSIHREVEYT